MKVKVLSIRGLEDACIALKMSKRHVTDEVINDIRDIASLAISDDGSLIRYSPSAVTKDAVVKMADMLDKVAKWGAGVGHDTYLDAGHETLLKFIDVTIVVQGLHRGAMDDLRTHSYRMGNRFISSSTRFLGAVKEGEMGSWYNGKIKYFDHKEQPDIPGYVKTPFGYVTESMSKDPDVLRGLYPLAIPTDFIFKCDFQNLRHIYMRRNYCTHAHPELGDMMEDIANQIEDFLFPSILGRLIRCDYCVGEYGNDPRIPRLSHIYNIEKQQHVRDDWYELRQNNIDEEDFQ